VITVPAEMLTRTRPTMPAPPAGRHEEAVQDGELRAWARKHVERVRKLKRDLAIYVLGMTTLTGIWMLVEWQDNGGFQRLSDNGNPGDWEPWVLYVALIWGFFLVLDALKVYFDRPATEADIDRELERLASRR
jgi:2TM domain-containing protein